MGSFLLIDVGWLYIDDEAWDVWYMSNFNPVSPSDTNAIWRVLAYWSLKYVEVNI